MSNFEYNRRATQDDFLKQTNEVRDERRVVPLSDILDAPLYCLKFNEDWKSHIIGAVSTLQTWTAWIGDDDDTNTGTRQITKFLGQDFEDCGDDCTIEILLADDSFFETEYVPATFGDYYAETLANETAQNALYDGTPQSIAPDAPVGTPNAIAKNALCAAVNRFVSLYASTKLCLIQSKNFAEILWTKLANSANNFYDAVVSLMSPIYTPNIFSCFVNDAAAITALQDDAAIEELACHIYDYLKTLTMSQSNFDDAISDAATSLSGNAADIACLMLHDNNLSLYINMLESYQIQLQKQNSNQEVDCPCESDAYWMWLFDFANGAQGWFSSISSNQLVSILTGGEWVNNASANFASCWIQRNFDSNYVIKACGVDYDVLGFTGNGGDSVQSYGREFISLAGAQYITDQVSFLSTNGNNLIRNGYDPTETNDSQSYFVGVSNAGAPSGSNLSRINRVVLYGLPDGSGNKPIGSVWVNAVPTSPTSLFP